MINTRLLTQSLDGADPASQAFGFGAILVLAGRAAHLEAVGRTNSILQLQMRTMNANHRIRGEGPKIIGHALACAVSTGFLVGCGPLAASVPPTRPPSQPPAANVALPPEWTPTSRPPPLPTLAPTPGFTPSLTSTPEPSSTDSLTPTSGTPTATPDLRTPRGVVQAAFSAYVARDDNALRELYDDQGREFCRSIAQSMLTCISYPYRLEGLSQLIEWWVEPPSQPQTSSGDFVNLYSRWRNSGLIWMQVFYLEKEGDLWLIHDHSTVVYGSAG